MIRNGVDIRDSIASGHARAATRLILTADTPRWARAAALGLTACVGSSGSALAAGLEREMPAAETPDGRSGVSVLLFALSLAGLKALVPARVGRELLSIPTLACYAGLVGGAPVPLGRTFRTLGKGSQIAKRVGADRVWRIPVLDGEFVCDDITGSAPEAVGGGHFLILARSRAAALTAAEHALEAMSGLQGVIGQVLRAPGGPVLAGSGPGAFPRTAYCPTLRAHGGTALSPEVGAVLEVAVAGLSPMAVAGGLRAGLEAVCALGAEAGILALDAVADEAPGRFSFHLRELLA